MRRLILTLLTGMLAAACNGPGAGPGSSAERAVVTGTAMYRERIMLPPTAVFEVKLEDVSRQDVAATVIGAARIDGPGPYTFSIGYDPAKIDERMTYSVRGTVTVDDQLMFTTDMTYPVLTRGAGSEAELLLKRVPALPADDNDDSAALEGTFWILTHLGGTEVELTEHSLQPHLVLEADSNRAGGSGDCNRFSGGYEVEGNKLTFGQLAMTMMACVEGMTIDNQLSVALDGTETFIIEAGRLELLDSGGTVLATFKAGEPPARD
ncbi:MAG: YbaY family lipoprotein [Woeseiaceae bacterium]